MKYRFAVLFLFCAAACGPCGGDGGEDAGTEAAPTPWHRVLQGERAPLLSAWEAPDGVLYAVGGNGVTGALVLRHDGQGWWEMDPGVDEPLWWVFGFSSSHVYAVGEKGTISWFNGTRWEVQRRAGPATLYGMWGARSTDLWAVGGGPTLSHRGPFVLRQTGMGFGPYPFVPPASGSDEDGNLFKVFGSSSDDVWFIGEDGLGARWNGSALERVTMPTKELLVTGVSFSREKAFIVGGFGRPVLLAWDGTAWTREPLEDDEGRGLFGVAISSAGDRRVLSGERGLLFDSDAGSAGLFRVAVDTPITFHAVAPVRSGFVAVGGNLDTTATYGELWADHDLAPGPRAVWPNAPLPLPQSPDAGADAGVADGGSMDAGLTDAGVPKRGPGEFCDDAPRSCNPKDECWLLVGPNRAICSRLCQTVADCGDFGPNPCCEIPGPQVTAPVCIPSSVWSCDGGTSSDGG